MTLAELRQRKNITQIQLSEMTGLSQTQLSKIEMGYVNPHPSSRIRIEKALGHKVSWDNIRLQKPMLLGYVGGREEKSITLKEARLAKKLTQSKLSELSGVSYSVINYLENGHACPKKATKRNIERVLSINIDWIQTRLNGTKAHVLCAPLSSPERTVIQAIFTFVAQTHTHPDGYNFKFLKRIIRQMQADKKK